MSTTTETAALTMLPTEQINPACACIDGMGTLEALRAINEQDRSVADAVATALPRLAGLVDASAERLAHGGRLIYVGAGTSGRLGVLDASECPPTFGVSPELVQGIIAGGHEALWSAAEGAEDRIDLGRDDLLALDAGMHDVVVGIAASGRTPYVIGALDHARSVGALTGSISCVSPAELSSHADHAIECVTGPEAICGSTRMKAGTAQKMLLNMLSTEVMVRLGKVYGNLMVSVRPTNEKLVARARRIVAIATGCDETCAAEALGASGYDVKVAILMVLFGMDAKTCHEILDAHCGNVSDSIRETRARFA